MRVLIVGFGAVGSLLAFKLRNVQACPVHCLGRENEHFRTTEKHGLECNSDRCRIHLYSNLSDVPTCDIMILTVPLHQMPKLLSELEQFSLTLENELDYILPLENGITINDTITRAVLPNVYGVMAASCHIEKPGLVVQDSPKFKITVAGRTKNQNNKLKNHARIFRDAGIQFTVTRDGPKAIWQKAAYQIPLAAACCAYRCTAGVIKKDKAKWQRVLDSAEEIAKAAKKKGVEISLPQVNFLLQRVRRDMIPSPAFDVLENKLDAKNTELPYLIEPILKIKPCKNLEKFYQTALAKRLASD